MTSKKRFANTRRPFLHFTHTACRKAVLAYSQATGDAAPFCPMTSMIAFFCMEQTTTRGRSKHPLIRIELSFRSKTAVPEDGPQSPLITLLLPFHTSPSNMDATILPVCTNFAGNRLTPREYGHAFLRGGNHPPLDDQAHRSGTKAPLCGITASAPSPLCKRGTRRQWFLMR